MLIETVAAGSYEEARGRILEIDSLVDGIELRLDYFDTPNLREIATLRGICSKVVIFTLRSQDQGGLFRGSFEEKRDLILELAKLQPTYFDLDFGTPVVLQQQVGKRCSVLISYHDFNKVPGNLTELLQQMQNPYATCYKIAAYTPSTVEALRLMLFISEKTRQGIQISGIPLGPIGSEMRAMGPVVGNLFDYAGSLKNLAQMSSSTLRSTYRYLEMSKRTSLYALIGNPVDKSYGASFHNQFFKQQGVDALYLRLVVTPQELPTLFTLMSQLPFKGLSVTTPLKEEVIPYLTKLTLEAKAIGAVNTILFKDQDRIGMNTDGRGALRAIKRRMNSLTLSRLNVILIGAGGAAKALCYHLCKAGATVTVLNRSFERGHELATRYGCAYQKLSDLSLCLAKGCDLLIKTLPSKAFEEGELYQMLSLSKVPTYTMDIVSYPPITPFLHLLIERGSIPILGLEMFLHQALLQQKAWSLSEEALTALN